MQAGLSERRNKANMCWEKMEKEKVPLLVLFILKSITILPVNF